MHGAALAERDQSRDAQCANVLSDCSKRQMKRFRQLRNGARALPKQVEHFATNGVSDCTKCVRGVVWSCHIKDFALNPFWCQVTQAYNGCESPFKMSIQVTGWPSSPSNQRAFRLSLAMARGFAPPETALPRTPHLSVLHCLMDCSRSRGNR
jgi:hypothetical protein